jgi:hypothetical protein
MPGMENILVSGTSATDSRIAKVGLVGTILTWPRIMEREALEILVFMVGIPIFLVRLWVAAAFLSGTSLALYPGFLTCNSRT